METSPEPVPAGREEESEAPAENAAAKKERAPAERAASRPREPEKDPEAQASDPPSSLFASSAVGVEAYIETNYQWNFNDPENGITNARGFDNRHNSFTLSNAALGLHWDYKNFVGRILFQIGHTPSSYYAAEPTLAGTASTNASNAELWKYIQEARAGYRLNLGQGLLLEAGLFLSPVGPESIQVHRSWNWSRSNLFFALPYYHTGLRASYSLSERWTAVLGGYNGINNVVDNNREKSLHAQLLYKLPETLDLSLLYFSGVERNAGAAEGRAWRHLFDAHVTWQARSWLALRLHGDAGFEPNAFGTSAWAAGALYARLRLHRSLFAALRGDFFYERVPSDGQGRATPIFWPVQWVSSGTATLEYLPLRWVSLRLEYRYDRAADRLYFGGSVLGDGKELPFVPDRRSQSTLTLGATAWLD